jgi:hypothetical protein
VPAAQVDQSAGRHRSEKAAREPPKPILGSSFTTKSRKMAAKLLVLEDFTRNSFKRKDLAGIFS